MKYFTTPPLGTPLNPAHPLNRGLVGYWNFSEGAGSKTQDISGKGNKGTLTGIVQGSTSGWSGGKFGKALRFDGVDDYVQIAHSDSLNPSKVTISVWVKPAVGTQKAYARILEKLFSNSYYLGVDSVGTRFKGILANSANPFGTLNSSTVITSGVWYHVVITHDGVTDRLYVNGVQEVTEANSVSLNNTVDVVRIGQYTLGTTYEWNGLISEARIYNRALTASEIKQLYTDPFCMYEQKNVFRWFTGSLVAATMRGVSTIRGLLTVRW